MNILTYVIIAALATPPVDSTSFVITNFGAVGNKTTLNTSFIQRAIDSCAVSGGGMVVVPAGDFLTGTIYIKTGVTLHIQAGGTLWGSPETRDYPDNPSPYIGGRNLALVVANDAERIGISGPGTIDGQGASPAFRVSPKEDYRPKLIQFNHCRHISVTDIALRNSAYWVQYYFYCEDLRMNDVNVYSFSNFNNDGVDIDARDVTVTHCTFNAEDDGICLKSNAPESCSNIEISDCVVSSDCNGIKFGTGSTTGFEHIHVDRCVVQRPPESPLFNWQLNIPGVTDSLSVISGIALEITDGGIMDDVTIENVKLSGIQTPLFIKLGDRSRKNPNKQQKPGAIRHITISQVDAENVSKMSSSITGFPGNYVEDITLKDITFTSPGGGTVADTGLTIPENQSGYPENRMLGPTLPAYGLYIRHAKDIHLKNVSLRYVSDDVRPAIYIEDADKVTGTDLKTQPPAGGGLAIRVVGSTGIKL